MKKPQYLTVKNSLFALTLAVLFAIPSANVRAQSSEEYEAEQQQAAQRAANDRCDWLCQLREAQSQLLEGSWDVIVTPVVPPGVPQPPSFVAHATFARGGGSFGSDRTRPLGKQHGAWEHLGGRNFAYTHKEDLFDAMGNFDGVLVVRVRITLNNKDEFTGVANGENRDASGNVRFNRCTTVRGARIRVEALSEQCQSITPPQ